MPSIRILCSSRDSPGLRFQPPDGLDLSKSFAQLSLPSQFYLHHFEKAASSSAAAAAASASSDEFSGPRVLVHAEAGIDARSQFGPLQGESILEKDIPEDFHMKDLWQIFAEDVGEGEVEGVEGEEGEEGHRRRRRHRLYVSTVNPEKSNWLRYMRPAPNRRARNVAAVVEGDQLYFVTLRDLKKDEEVLYWIDDPDLMWTKKRAEKKSRTRFLPLHLARSDMLGRQRVSFHASHSFTCRLRRLQRAILAPAALPHPLHGLPRPAVLVDDPQVPLQSVRARGFGQREHRETRHDGARRKGSVPVPIL